MIFQPVIPAVLVVLIVLAVAAAAVWRLVRSRGGTRLIWVSRILLVFACGLLLLRPGVPGGESQTLATEVDVVFVIDTTASIVAEDWNGDNPRIDGVRADVQDIVNRYPGARFCVITFDADAVVRVPLTTDSTAIVSSVSVLRPEVTANSRGSSVGVAAPLLEDTLQAAKKLTPERIRLAFYLGDGEQTSSGAVESFDGSADLISGGAVLGYGTAAGGPMRTTSLGNGPGPYITYQGEQALSTIDPANLNTIADDLGVTYQERTAGEAVDLPDIPATTTTADGSTQTVAEFSWIVALVIAALLAVELARAMTLLVTTARVPSRTRSKGDA
ncbi:MAG: VWA domain-containing protein [Pseudolysinimonas sp.]|uniref:VWA domain-containing protein n=1 Tax=Pseudolysinimonas sp. TaxID=2680009 RepID=UPI003266D39F